MIGMDSNTSTPDRIDNIDFSKVCMDPSEVDYVIYHSNCSDGFGSALCAHKYFSERSNLDPKLSTKQPIFYPARFGVLPPLESIEGKCVLICDFSYKKDALDK